MTINNNNNNNSKNNALIGVLKEWTKYTTIHGIGDIGRAPNAFICAVWLLAWLTVCSVMGAQLYGLVDTYLHGRIWGTSYDLLNLDSSFGIFVLSLIKSPHK